MPNLDQAQGMHRDRRKRAPSGTQGVQGPIRDGWNANRQEVLRQLQPIGPGRTKRDRLHGRPERIGPAAQMRQAHDGAQRHITQQVPDQVIEGFVAELGQQPLEDLRIRPMPPHPRMQRGIAHQRQGHPCQRPGRGPMQRHGPPIRASTRERFDHHQDHDQHEQNDRDLIEKPEPAVRTPVLQILKIAQQLAANVLITDHPQHQGEFDV